VNPRIRELVRESHLDVYGLGKDRDKWEHTIEKFAELIVKECAQFVEDKFDFIGDEIIVKEKMLEHFGVEP
jgi:hypothetical protein